MAKKTEGVKRLVKDVLAGISEPYGEDITEDVCMIIEHDLVYRQRYQRLADELGDWVVNNWIGRYTKRETGMKSIKQVKAKRATIIGSYSKLSY